MTKLNKIIYSILLLLIILLFYLIAKDKLKSKLYMKEYNYFNGIQIVTLNINNEKIFNKIDNLYKEYEMLIDTSENYNNVKDLNYIKNNNSSDKYITIDKKLYDMIQYGLDMYKLTKGAIDISKNNYTDESNIAKIILKDNNKILNNHVKINLDEIKEEYINKQIEKLLKDNRVKKYAINMNDTILVSSKGIKTAIPDPDNELKILKTINMDYKCTATINNINFSKYKSVTVSSNDNCESIAIMIMLNDNVNISDIKASIYVYTKDKKIHDRLTVN